MKKSLHTILMLALLSKSALAQLTITSTDMAKVGQQYSYTQLYSGVKQGGSGTNQTWDFSTLLLTQPPVLTDKINVYGMDTTGYTSQFPSATFALGGVNTPNGSDSYHFYELDNVSLRKSADKCPMNSLGCYTYWCSWPTAQTILTFPSTYQTQFLQDYVKTAESCFALDSYYSRYTKTESVIDGYGTVTLPNLKTYASIRQKMTEYSIDSSMVNGSTSAVFDTVIAYKWWSQNMGLPVFETHQSITNASNNNYTRWIDSLGNYLVKPSGVNELKNLNDLASVYPNPSSGVLHIDLKSTASMTFDLLVFNALGEKVFSSSERRLENTWDLSSLGNGVYFCQLQSQNETVGYSKLVIEK